MPAAMQANGFAPEDPARRTVENIPKFVARAKDKNDPFRLMGFGHRVYKNYDPRAKIMQKTAYEID